MDWGTRQLTGATGDAVLVWCGCAYVYFSELLERAASTTLSGNQRRPEMDEPSHTPCVRSATPTPASTPPRIYIHKAPKRT